ncbi:GntR family transcriptional regulator [Comamonas testosteroni]|uniref:GntR family transcriptional regulator n=1 Tax=Comamonas testosteroni TaxID=285 RepID=UPI00389A82A9
MRNASIDVADLEEPSDVVRSSGSTSTLTTQVYERLRDDIVSGALTPGQRLTSDLLKERYGLGMTPLREALQRLSASKLVTAEDRRGFRVAPISPGHLAEVIDLREAIEVLLLQNSFKNASVRWESRIVAAYHGLQRTADYKFNPGPYTVNWEDAHREFHFALLSAARLPMLEEFHLALWDHSSRYRNLAYAGKLMSPDVFDGHQQLMDAALARDGELACMLLRRHISLAMAHIKGSLFPDELAANDSR